MEDLQGRRYEPDEEVIEPKLTKQKFRNKIMHMYYLII